MATALIVIAILVFLIVAHEFGHFIAAKIFNVRVDEFGIGYPPRAFLIGKLGETEYTLNWLPFGGFVRLFGEDGSSEKGGRPQRSLAGANRGIQASILVAGVLMNAVAAWLLFAAALSLGTPRPIDPATNIGASGDVQLIISGVVPGSPADVAGLKVGDRITGIISEKDTAAAKLNPDLVPDFMASRGGEPIDVEYMRNGAPDKVMVRPANGIIEGQAGRPAIGVQLTLITTEPLTVRQSLLEAAGYTWRAFEAVVSGLWMLIAGAFEGTSHLSEVVGPVGLASVVGDAARHGVGNILSLAAFVSVNLAIINLLPLPALDGGRLMLLGIEAIRRRQAPHALVQLVNGLGFAFIVILMLVVTYNDISRLLA